MEAKSKAARSLSETHLVISQPTSLPQAADAKRDQAEAGELGHRYFSTFPIPSLIVGGTP